MKKARELRGFDFELAPDRFFDLEAVASIVAHEFVDGFTGFIALSNYSSGNTGPDENWPTKRHIRINHDRLWLIGLALSSEREQPHGQPRGVPFYAA